MRNWFLLTLLALACLSRAAWADQPIKVACVGDSITYGYNLPDPSTQSYPAVLGRLLGSGYQVGNFGLSGRCMLKQGNTPYWNEAAFPQSMAFQPDAVVIQLGTNDMSDVNFQYIGNFIRDYEDMIARYRALASHPIVYVCLPPPISGDYGHGYSAPRLQNAILPLIRQAAAETGAVLIDNNGALSDVPQDFLDSLHPNIDGSIRLAGNVFLALAPPGTAVPDILNDTDGGISYHTTLTDATGVPYDPTLSGTPAGGFAYLQNRTAGDIRQDLHVSRTYDDSVSYTFRGNGLDFLSELSPEGGNVDCYIDGAFVKTVSCFNANLYAQQAVFSILGLSPGLHTFQAIHKGPTDATQQAASIATDNILLKVDAFRVYQPVADFSLSGPTGVLMLPSNGSAKAFVAVHGINGYAGTTTFKALGLPAGITAQFVPAVSGSGSATLVLAASGAAVRGTTTITVEGDCGPAHRQIALQVKILGPGAAPTLKTSVLWTNPDGKAILWNAAPDGTFAIVGVYGPYLEAGHLWKATGVATGPDGLSHVLWTHPSGKVILWNVAADGAFAIAGVYGPFNNGGGLWSAQSLFVGSDNVPHLLWTNPDGRAALWNVAADGTFTTVGVYGPYNDGGGLWRATALSVGPDGLSHLLWDNPDGRAVLWTVVADGAFAIAGVYGPYNDGGGFWKATALSVGPDNAPHLLWVNPDGRALLWNIASDGAFAIVGVYGPYTDGAARSPWSATTLATGPDGLSHLLWTNPDGKDALWLVDGAGNFKPFIYGPYTDDPDNLWTPVAISAGS